jgi:hypothetical protein
MADEREKNEARLLADKLRGVNQQALGEARQAGRQMSNQVGKMQTVGESRGPNATPKVSQDQNPPSSAARFRHVGEKDQQAVSQRPPAANTIEPTVKNPQPGKVLDQGKVAAVAKDKNLAEMARGLRESGVSQSRAAKEVATPKQTPEQAQRQSRGRGR